MTGINNNDIYLRKMRNTFKDKAWWAKNIPEDVNTIVDFGCADGSFLWYIKKKKRAFTSYFGIEENREFQKSCSQKGFVCYESLDDAVHDRVNPDTSLLILNSVLHEVAHYGDIQFLWDNIATLGFRYVAIRDMMPSNYGLYSSKTEEYLKREIYSLGLKSRLDDFKQYYGDIHDGKTALHFMLKYFYEENWARECQENYLSLDYGELHKMIRRAGYNVHFLKQYALPYLIKKWREDFRTNEIDLNNRPLARFISEATTHVKMFIARDDIEHDEFNHWYSKDQE